MTKQSRCTRVSRPSPLNWVDVLGIFVLTLFLLAASYLRSRHRMFWSDEIMGWLVLNQPSWHALLQLWHTGFDSSGIWFYVFGRPWAAVFGVSEVSLRTYSALCVSASAAVLWIAARRFYSILPVAASIGLVYAGTDALSWQLANARTYGLFLLGISLVILMLLLGEDETRTKPSTGFLLATFAAYALLNGSYTLGFLYSSAFIATQLAFDLRARRLRPLLYLSAIAAFSVVAFSRGNILGTAATGKPSYWTIRPTFTLLFEFNGVFEKRIALTLLGLAVLGLILRMRPRPNRNPIYLLALGFAALDLLIFLYSRIGTSIFVDRYLLPFSIIAVLLMCELLTQIEEAPAPLPRLRAAIPLAFIAVALSYLFIPGRQRHWLPFPDYTGSLLASLPPGLPVVDTDVTSFREVHFYHHETATPFLFPVDWPVALDRSNTGGVSGFHEMDSFKQHGTDAQSILPTSDILSRYRDFIVITSTKPTAWVRMRILADPRYTVVKYGTHKAEFDDLEIWQVHTR